MKKKLIAAIMGILMIFCFAACGETAGDSGSAGGEEVATENDIAEVEVQDKELPGGTYVVGEDFAAGKYNFTYKTEMSEEDYWGNDYFYILRAGSEGTDETLGGTKFDERFGGFEYGAASQGKTSYANLKNGDTIMVDADEGTWTY